MKECGNGPEVINDEDGNSHIGREISYEAGVGIETPRRTGTTGKSFAPCYALSASSLASSRPRCALCWRRSLLERLQQGYGNVSWRTPLPHLCDDLTLPLHVCLTFPDVALNPL